MHRYSYGSGEPELSEVVTANLVRLDHAALPSVLLSRLPSICLRPQSNKSLDASGGSVFLNLIHPAMLG